MTKNLYFSSEIDVGDFPSISLEIANFTHFAQMDQCYFR